MKSVTVCLWCQSPKLENIAVRRDGVDIVKCNSCGLFMNQSIPNNPADYYQEEYFNSTEDEPDMGYSGEYSLTSPAFLLWQSAFIAATNTNNDKKYFLEIGSATGSLLEIVSEQQPELSVSGIDISNYAVEFSRKKGLDAEVAYVQEYTAKPKKDIIFSSETLEHLDDLKIFFDGVKKNLSKNGVFLFYVPSIVEKDARAEGTEYVRFKTKMEHLLHFTPDFFSKELPKYFGVEVLIKEIVSDYGPCILGAVTSDKKTITSLKTLFSTLDQESIPKKMSKDMLIYLAFFSLKFGKSSLSQKLITNINSSKDFSDKEKSLIGGLACYHSGELEKATKYFIELYKLDPGSTVALKLLYANQKELSQIYLEELYKVKTPAPKNQVHSRLINKVGSRVRRYANKYRGHS